MTDTLVLVELKKLAQDTQKSHVEIVHQLKLTNQLLAKLLMELAKRS